ncbi:hypothetical protein D3C83_237700 [compost metagenome]
MVANTAGIQMPPVMTKTFFFAFFAFTLLYAALVRTRYAFASDRDALEDAAAER